MGKGCSHIALTVLLVLNLTKTRSLPDPCSACAAGTFCGKAANQTCFLCPPNSFSSKSGQKACDICRKCEGVFRTKKPCSKTSNTECECVPGFSCVDAGCTQCKQDCEEGQQLTQEGCKDCAFGHFTMRSVAPAEPGQSHIPQFLIVLLLLMSTAVIILAFVLTLRLSMVRRGRKKFLYLLKQPFLSPVHTSQEEDGCSCSFPEEEAGGCAP